MHYVKMRKAAVWCIRMIKGLDQWFLEFVLFDRRSAPTYHIWSRLSLQVQRARAIAAVKATKGT